MWPGPGPGFWSDTWSSAKSSFNGYFKFISNAVRNPIGTGRAVASSISKMSAGELLMSPITKSPGAQLLKTEYAAAKAIIQGDGKTFGSIVGHETANTATVLAGAGAGEAIGKGVSPLKMNSLTNSVNTAASESAVEINPDLNKVITTIIDDRYLADFIYMAQKGLFSFDKTVLNNFLESRYHLVAKPVSPLKFSKLPSEITDILMASKYDGNIDSIIDSQTIT